MKAYSAKQIKHKLEKVNTFKHTFEREVIKTYGEEEGIKIDKTFSTETIDGVEYPMYMVYDEKEDGYTKTFRFAVQEYTEDGKDMMKVVEVLTI